jgi:hypothetical protein
VVAVSFCSPFEQIVEKMNFVVWDTTLWHCLGGAVVRTTSGILKFLLDFNNISIGSTE